MSEELKSLALLLSAVGALSIVIVHLYNRVNKLNDKMNNLQEQFRNEIISVHEKTLAMMPNIEKTIIDNSVKSIEKVVDKIEDKHKETQTVLKDFLK